ncbi:MAG: TIGR02444 family protein [Alphaproteobacteria bacterium]|nr:TIGR02444 family protein [Alphaproteobacteria bacterium]
MSGFPPHPFWNWSLDVYGRPGVSEILLDLQDRHGLDVNLLLFACWIGATGRGRLGGGEWARLIGGTAGWRAEIVEPLRAVRRHLKGRENVPGAMALREKVKASELEAEYCEQMMIVDLAGDRTVRDIPASDRAADAVANLESCFAAAAGAPPSDGDRVLVTLLARSCCGDPPSKQKSDRLVDDSGEEIM